MTIPDAKPLPAPRRSRRRWIPAAIIAGAAFAILLSPLWAPLFLQRMAFFRVRHVQIVGARYVASRDILERLKVDTLASVWDPTEPLEARIAGHPLVRSVSVGRKLPGTLVVRLEEHIPVALVPTANGFRAYDERGVPLPIDLTSVDVDAPIVDRPDSALFRLLGAARTEAPELYRRLSEVRHRGTGPVGTGGTSGAELLLLVDSVHVRALADVTLHRLSDIGLVEQDLARRRLRAAELDLRYRDQVIARLQ